MVPIVLPDMESVTEGVVVEWRVAVGDVVAAEQIVVEVSTDKVDLEVPAPAAGTLDRRSPSPPARPSPSGSPSARSRPAPARPSGRLRPERPRGAGRRGARAAPAARHGRRGPRVAAHHPRRPARRRSRRASTPSTITGTGPGGIIRKGDVLAAAAAPAAAAPAPAPAPIAPVEGEEAEPLRGPAAALAGYMDESLSIPTATSFRTLSVAVLDAQRRQINADLKAAGRSEKLSFTHLIAWAIIRAAQGAAGRWARAST